jgi:hypothetical protein
MKLFVFVIGLCTLSAVFATNGENAEPTEDLPKPPNEWGTYYALPADFQTMRDVFKYVFETQNAVSSGDFSDCEISSTTFERWYQSSEDPNSWILSYFCFGSESRGYEHLQVNWPKDSGKETAQFVAFKSKLSEFGIVNAGPYKKANTVEGGDKNGKAGKEQSRLTEAVKDQILAQKKDGSEDPMCLNPSTKTVYKYVPKEENGLFYTKFPVSCDDSSGEATYMMDVEVVEDKTFKVINGGNPQLVVVYEPRRNIVYIQESMSAEKQSNGAEHLKSFLSLALMSVVYRLF